MTFRVPKSSKPVKKKTRRRSVTRVLKKIQSTSSKVAKVKKVKNIPKSVNTKINKTSSKTKEKQVKTKVKLVAAVPQKPVIEETDKVVKQKRERVGPFIMNCGHFSWWFDDELDICQGCDGTVIRKTVVEKGKRGSKPKTAVKIVVGQKVPKVGGYEDSIRIAREALAVLSKKKDLTDEEREFLSEVQEREAKSAVIEAKIKNSPHRGLHTYQHGNFEVNLGHDHQGDDQ